MLVRANINLKGAIYKTAIGSIGLSLIVGVLPMFSLVQGLWVGFAVFLYGVLGFLLPQRYLQGISKLRYTVCMLLLLLMIGTFLKMAVRLGFNVKYIVSIPQVSLNI